MIGIPVEQMSSTELGQLNRARNSAEMLPLVVGFKAGVECQGIAGLVYARVTFTEGLDNPIVAFIAQLSHDCRKQWGEGRLDALKDRFVWQPLALCPKPGERRR